MRVRAAGMSAAVESSVLFNNNKEDTMNDTTMTEVTDDELASVDGGNPVAAGAAALYGLTCIFIGIYEGASGNSVAKADSWCN